MKVYIYYVSENENSYKGFISFDEFIAGWISGVAGLVCSFPFDTIKVLQQHQSKQSMLKIVKHIAKTEGLMSLYRGIIFPAQLAGISNAAFFGVYGNTLRFWRNFKNRNEIKTGELTDYFIGGIVGGLAESCFLTPTEIVKIRQQTDRITGRIMRSMAGTCKVIFKEKGILGFYNGFLATILREVPSGGVYIVLYNTADKFCRKYMPPYWAHCVAGGYTGAVSYAIFQPADVIKTRLQADSLLKPKYRGTFDCIIQSYREDGLSIFWRGITSQLLRSFVSNAAIFVVYELTLNSLEHFSSKS